MARLRPGASARRLFVAAALVAGGALAPTAAGAAPPGPQLSVADARVVETDSGYADLVFEVTLTNPTGRTITADYATADGTATAPDDYLPTSGQVVFNKRETRKQIRVPVLGDTTYEGDETMTLTLTRPAGAVIADG